jgi:hypothetical protein
MGETHDGARFRRGSSEDGHDEQYNAQSTHFLFGSTMGDCALYTQDIFPLAWSHSHWSCWNRAPPWNVLAGTGMQQRPPPFNPPHTAFHCRLRLPLHHGQASRIGHVRKARCDTVYPTQRGGRGRGERGVRGGVFQSFPGPAF